jgi:hypothetical protein
LTCVFPAAKAKPAQSTDGASTFEDIVMTEPAKKQLLHLVFGGELTALDSHEFKDLSKLDIVGMFPDYASAEKAWRAKAQQTVDSAQTRYYVVHLHRLIEPDLAPPTRIA